MAASFHLSSFQLQGPLQKSTFLGQTQIPNLPPLRPKSTNSTFQTPVAKFNLFEILGGRGLCNGEEGIEKELKKIASGDAPPPPAAAKKAREETEEELEFPEDAFDKEMLGFTGGFPGGEKGLKKFIEENPPPEKSGIATSGFDLTQLVKKKPKPPELPMLLPGMIAIVKNSNSPYYMYCGIVQRITDGKAAVLFEGGIWDRLISFRLDELERREKGPPMANPRSAILETMVENSSET